MTASMPPNNMPVINTTCPECGGSLEIGFGSRCLYGQLIWSASHRCNDCDHALEEDSWDTIPDEYRQLELQLDGVWAIQLPPADYSTTTALKIIRQRLGLSLSETTKVKKQLPGPILAGTEGEMATVAYHLSASGIAASVIPAK